jgi:hypothetical protein
MIEERIEKLEERSARFDGIMIQLAPKINEMVGALGQMPKASDYGTMRADIAEIKGKISNLPTTWTLLAFALSSAIAAAGLAFAIARLIKP